MYIADNDQIRQGQVTDIYFERTWRILAAEDIHKNVTVEVKAASLPEDYPWAVLAGVEEVIDLLTAYPINVRTMPEGTVFRADEPVLSITGDYLEFGRAETAVLGYLCQASGIATKAARCKKAAGSRQLISFGARRMHPALAPMIERNAFIGGCDGVSTVLAAEQLGIPPSGTMPHALILIVGDVAEACRLFDKVIPPEVKRVALVDTFCDEKMEAVRAAEILGDRLYGVRLDTPGSRRGNFSRIIDEVRWELDIRGFQHVKIIVSGGIDEQKMLALNPLVDGYGVGTSISNAPVVDFALDIVEIEGQPVAKRGKKSGLKQTLLCESCGRREVVLESRQSTTECLCGGLYRGLLVDVIESGRLTGTSPPAQQIRKYVLKQLESLQLEE